MNFIRHIKYFKVHIILIFFVFLFSCRSENKEDYKPVIKNKKEALEKINQLLVEKDQEVIKSYIARRGWDMQVSKTGLWYMIYKKGEGPYIKTNDRITLNYKVWLISGELMYSSDSLGVKCFIVGMGGVQSGLEEGVLMLQQGSKARFIMPPHLAHGLLGDENKIPARATIIYDVEILSIK